MKLWGRERNAQDPWDSPEQKNGKDPWDSPDQKNAQVPWDSVKQGKDAEHPSAVPDRENEPSAVSEQENELSPVQERDTSEGYGIRIAGAVMTLVSYVLLFRLPDELTYTDYGVFFLSVLLFCVGFFWAAAGLPEPAAPVGAFLRNAGICTAAAALLAVGCQVITMRDGSEGSMYIGTVLLIQSLASLSALSGDWKARAGCAVRAVSIGMAAWGLWLFIRFLRTEHGGDGPLSAAVLLWIASIALYQMFGTGGEKTQNAGEGIRKKYPKNKDGA